jgi:hypothetical protein
MMSQPRPQLDPQLRRRLDELFAEGYRLQDRFQEEVRRHGFHPFIAANYEQVLDSLLPLRAPGLRFLEWGSGTGVIAIMADMLGFDAAGIEIDAGLVRTARELADRFGSGARFAAGSFLPAGYRWDAGGGDGRLGTIEEGVPGYVELGRELDEYDVVYGYPWGGEEPIMLDVLTRYCRSDARLMLHYGSAGIRVLTPAEASADGGGSEAAAEAERRDG